MSKSLAISITRGDDDYYDDDGNLKESVKTLYEDKYNDVLDDIDKEN